MPEPLVWVATTRTGATYHHTTATEQGIAGKTRCGRSTRTGVVMTRPTADAYRYKPCDLCWPDGAL